MDISVGYGYEKRSKTIGGPPEGGERSRSSAGEGFNRMKLEKQN